MDQETALAPSSERTRISARTAALSMPRHVVTQGLGTIGDAAHVVMIATGTAKAEPIAAMVEGPVSAMCPASVLQFHPHVTVLIDEQAARGLRSADFHRETSRHKPTWQHL